MILARTMSVQIVSDRAVVVLLDDFDDNGPVRLCGFLNDFILGMIARHCVFIMLDLFFDLFHGPLVVGIFLEHKVQGLANTGRFDSFHQYFLPNKIKYNVRQPDLRTFATRCMNIIFQIFEQFNGYIRQNAEEFCLVKFTKRGS
jgi:hypothetical protein